MPAAAIVGAGLIGRAWAHVFARAGWQVRVWDPAESQRACVAELITGSLHELARHGLVADPEGAARRVSIVASLEQAVGEADFVQESGPEVLETKRAVFQQMDEVAPPATVLASSSSAIVPSRFTAGLRGRARCIVAHPVNPPHLVPVVELCGAPWTDASTRERSREVMRALGQVPIEVRREIDGFILNRLQAALLSEAFRLVEDGYVSPQDLDHTIADGLGLRWAFMGPFETIELNAPGGVLDYCERYRDWFRRYAADPPPPSVWDLEQWRKAAAAWGRTPSPQQIAGKSLWRDARLAALAAHKRSQKPFEE
jgi:L-gulonate 3-dehydrogenase